MEQITMNDLLLQESKRNPSAFYAQLRQQEPLCYVADFGGRGAWIATTYEDAIAILKDPRFIRDRRKVDCSGDRVGMGGSPHRLRSPQCRFCLPECLAFMAEQGQVDDEVMHGAQCVLMVVTKDLPKVRYRLLIATTGTAIVPKGPHHRGGVD